MRTFKFTLGLDFKVVVPDAFVQSIRDAATAEDASPFLSHAHAENPEDDEAFILVVLKNGIRKEMRRQLLAMLQNSGLGGTVAPASIEPIDISEALSAEPVLATEIDQALQGQG